MNVTVLFFAGELAGLRLDLRFIPPEVVDAELRDQSPMVDRDKDRTGERENDL